MDSQYLPQTRGLIDAPSRIMREENRCFVDQRDAPLLFPAAEILQVACPPLNQVHLPGRDFLSLPETDSLRRSPGSAMPRLTSDELHLRNQTPVPFPDPGANHPNDFGHRLHASVVLDALRG